MPLEFPIDGECNEIGGSPGLPPNQLCHSTGGVPKHFCSRAPSLSAILANRPSSASGTPSFNETTDGVFSASDLPGQEATFGDIT